MTEPKRVVVVERGGRETAGALVYLHNYPHAVHGEDGRIERFESRPQRVGIVTDAGRLWHFTVPAEVLGA